MMMGCGKCRVIGAIVFLVLGVLFLLKDLGTWDFWNISWWTALFLWFGIAGFCMSKCPDCCATMGSKKR